VSGKTKSALITIEAALVLPIFMLVLTFFLYFYQVMMVQEALHMSGTKVAKDISSYGPLFNLLMKYEGEETSKVVEETVTSQDSYLSQAFEEVDVSSILGMLIDDLYLQQRLYTELGDSNMIKRCIVGGFDGISFIGSSVFDDEECITIIMTYQLKTPMFETILPSLPVVQKVRIRSFNGYAVASKVIYDKESQEDTKEEMVYITENASVYHTKELCTHLRLSTKSISSSMLETIRNKYGGIYRECETCFNQGDSTPVTIYITDQGNCYHKNTACSALKRTVSKVPLSKVSHLSECKRCQSSKTN
jgi:hypothetical protein